MFFLQILRYTYKKTYNVINLTKNSIKNIMLQPYYQHYHIRSCNSNN